MDNQEGKGEVSPEETGKLLDGSFGLDGVTYLMLFVVCAVSGFLGSYFSSYAKQKGKNFATKEDLDILIEKTGVLAKAAEEVKSEIARNSWVESKKWQLKFRIYTEVLEALAVWRVSISEIKNEASNRKENREIDKDKLAEISRQIKTAFEGLAKIEAVAEIGLSREQSDRIRKLKEVATDGMGQIELDEAFRLTIDKIKQLESELANEAKKELFR